MPARGVRAQGRGRGAVGGALGLPGRGREGKGVPGRQLGPRKNSGARVMPARGVRAQGRGRGAVGGALEMPGRGKGGKCFPSRQPAVSERKGGVGRAQIAREGGTHDVRQHQ